nr:transcription factor A, mitochondrial [Megalopta genalis]
MAGFGRFILSVDSRSFLCARNCLVKISQNKSKYAKVQGREVELPPKPKKPLTTFLIYLRTIRSKLREENSDQKMSEVVKEASKDWANLDPALKKDFEAQYEQNYKKYILDMKHYQESLTDEHKLLLQNQKQKSLEKSTLLDIKRKMESFNKPRRPINAFLMYLHSKRHVKTADISLKEWLSITTNEWTKLPDAERHVYVNEAKKLMDQYKENLMKWEEDMISLGQVDIIRRKKYKNLFAKTTKDS